MFCPLQLEEEEISVPMAAADPGLRSATHRDSVSFPATMSQSPLHTAAKPACVLDDIALRLLHRHVLILHITE
jgi:hypothetical protein